MALYIYTTADKYELPVAVKKSIKELAEAVGVKHTVLYVYMRRGYRVFKIREEEYD